MRIHPKELYNTLATRPDQTGFIAHPMILADGTQVAGVYRGFGTRGVLVRSAPKPREKGFRSLGPVDGDFDGYVRIRD